MSRQGTTLPGFIVLAGSSAALTARMRSSPVGLFAAATGRSPRSTRSSLIREAIGPEHTVLLDSGIRSGADVFVALALGADAVLLGRPHVYGLAIDGAKGVSALIDNVVAELDLTMGLFGAASVADITRDLLLPAP